MKSGARTPEELETLFEDAFVVRDPLAFDRLLEDGAVFASVSDAREARGTQIVGFATAMWGRGYTYVAEPRRVLQAGDTALVVSDHGICVVRRGCDRLWRYSISLLSLTNPNEEDA